MSTDITCVFEGVGGIGAIYISNLKAAQNVCLLNSLKIKAIVTAVRGGFIQHNKIDIQDYLYIPADDIQSYDLSKHFEETYNFIDNVRKKTNVLVHCYAGISRSATLVIAYLIKKYNYSLQKVITMVKRKRNKINPNKGFVNQLKIEANKLGAISQQNNQGVQEILRKYSASADKKRSHSTKSLKKLKDQIQNIRKSNNLLQSLHANKQELFNSNISKQEVCNNNLKNNQNLNIQKVSSNSLIKLNKILSHKQNQIIHESKDLKNPQISELSKNPDQVNKKQQTSVFQNKSNHLISTKLEKIQQFKIKVFELQNRKKAIRGHMHCHSQLRHNNRADNFKMTSIFSTNEILSLVRQQKSTTEQIILNSNNPLSPEKLRKSISKIVK